MQNNSSKLIRSRVRGTFHQGDITIFSPTSIGRQCVPNCVVAAAFACSVNMSKWTTKILNDILLEGDKVYRKIEKSHDYLLVSEITDISLFNNEYIVKVDSEFFGQMKTTVCSEVETSLHGAICAAAPTTEKWVYCVLCIGSLIGSSASLLCLSRDKCYLFDSHSRNKDGKSITDGTAILFGFQNKNHLATFIKQSPFCTPSQQMEIFSMSTISFESKSATAYNMSSYFSNQLYYTMRSASMCSESECNLKKQEYGRNKKMKSNKLHWQQMMKRDHQSVKNNCDHSTNTETKQYNVKKHMTSNKRKRDSNKLYQEQMRETDYRKIKQNSDQCSHSQKNEYNLNENNSGKRRRREMMKVHREQVRQRYHQNVQSNSKHAVNSHEYKKQVTGHKTNMMKKKKNPEYKKQVTDK